MKDFRFDLKSDYRTAKAAVNNPVRSSQAELAKAPNDPAVIELVNNTQSNTSNSEVKEWSETKKELSARTFLEGKKKE